MNDLLNLLKGVAPSLATAVAGPLGGAAVTALASKFGVSDSVDAVAKAIAGDPAAQAKLQELELEYAKIDASNTADARKMNSDIQNSATASWLAEKHSLCDRCGHHCWGVNNDVCGVYHWCTRTNKSMAFTALGSLLDADGNGGNFHRGSSAGSKAKTEELMKGMK